MKGRVALVGLGPLTHDNAPFEDKEWECWGLPWDNGYWANMDVLFEMHDRTLLEDSRSDRSPHYMDKLKNDLWQPVYMQQRHPDIPTSVEYPLEAVQQSVFKGFPRGDQVDWYNSSFAYLMAMAIHQGFTTISLFGWEMNGETGEHGSYQYQRPNANYLVGLAVGRGIEVMVPMQSSICRHEPEGIWLGQFSPRYPTRYGFLT